jgi:FkbM family methyltransferase
MNALPIATRKFGTMLRVLREDGTAAGGSLVRDKLTQLSHRRPGGLAQLDGCLFRVDDIKEGIRTDILRNDYEKEERAAIQRYLDRRLPVIELGGSMGIVSCITNKRLKDPKRHVVVEADPDNIPKLVANRDLNGCHFEVLQMALAYESEEVLFMKGPNSLSGGIYGHGYGQHKVKTVSLKKLALDRGMGRFTLICDIEGSEVDMVEHEREFIAAAIDTFMVEVHPGITGVARTEAMLATLRQIGFRTVSENTGTLVLTRSN